MNITGNTILITGGGSGIGRGLAEGLAKEGNAVIIAGRRVSALNEVTKANPAIKGVQLDISSADAIAAFGATMAKDFPKLNVVIHNAGMMKIENLVEGNTVADAEATITTNLLGPIRLTEALMPLLKKQPKATIMTVTSGLAFMPLTATPTYCATKAALHSYSESLRYQLRKTNIEVIELIPPYVQTELTGPQQAADPRAMPLKDFLSEVFQLLKSKPGAPEICVERVLPLRNAAETKTYDATFKMINEMAPF